MAIRSPTISVMDSTCRDARTTESRHEESRILELATIRDCWPAIATKHRSNAEAGERHDTDAKRSLMESANCVRQVSATEATVMHGGPIPLNARLGAPATRSARHRTAIRLVPRLCRRAHLTHRALTTRISTQSGETGRHSGIRTVLRHPSRTQPPPTRKPRRIRKFCLINGATESCEAVAEGISSPRQTGRTSRSLEHIGRDGQTNRHDIPTRRADCNRGHGMPFPWRA